MDSLKHCNRCNTTKSTADFHPHKRSKDKLQSWCKRCVVAFNKEAQRQRIAKKQAERNAKKQALIDAGLKCCSNCEQELSIKKFSKGQAYCKVCIAARAKSKYKSKKVSKIIPVKEDAVFPDAMAKRCGRCNEIKSFSKFYKSSSSADGYQSYCCQCAREFDREKQSLLKAKRKISKSQSHYNTVDYFENLRGKDNAGRPANDLFDLTPERIEFLNIQRQEWRKIFAERHDDVMVLIKAYEAEPDNSVHLITEFHNNIRPTWELQHKTNKQLKNEYYEFLKQKYSSKTIGGNDGGNETN